MSIRPPSNNNKWIEPLSGLATLTSLFLLFIVLCWMPEAFDSFDYSAHEDPLDSQNIEVLKEGYRHLKMFTTICRQTMLGCAVVALLVCGMLALVNARLLLLLRREREATAPRTKNNNV